MPATLRCLISLSSQRTEWLCTYFRALEAECAKTRLLLRFGRSLHDVRIPLRVVPFEPIQHTEEAIHTEHFRSPAASYDDDDHAKKRYAYPTLSRGDEEEPKYLTPRPLLEVESELQHAVLLADPGGGKTEWLKYRTLEVAREAREALEKHTRRSCDITFPAFLRLDDVAERLGRTEAEESTQEQKLCDFLMRRDCTSERLETLNDAQRVGAAMLMVLVQKNPFGTGTLLLPEPLAPFVWQQWLAAPTSSGARAAGTSLLCLDAWDEVRGGQDLLARCLTAFAQVSPCRMFLTSRICWLHAPPVACGKQP